jgi:hypothetical protein
MGITINHKLAQEVGYIKSTLDNAESMAKLCQAQGQAIGLPVSIQRGNRSLAVDIAGCETLMLDFMPLAYWKAKAEPKPRGEGWCYQWASLKKWADEDTTGEHYEKYPEQKLLFAADSCKTQFAGHLAAHRFVAEILRAAASRCRLAKVDDEGGYYHTGRIEDAAEAIGKNGALINAIGKQLAGMGWQAVKGGETKIKGRRRAG